MTEHNWRLLGFDAFEEEYYPLGDFDSEAEVKDAGSTQFQIIEKLQPAAQTGGQCDDGIQDRLFIQRPDGTTYRFIPIPEDLN